jgi:peptidoglycan/xylan/chitin deacetylase (PgdA/CDA1 family)
VLSKFSRRESEREITFNRGNWRSKAFYSQHDDGWSRFYRKKCYRRVFPSLAPLVLRSDCVAKGPKKITSAVVVIAVSAVAFISACTQPTPNPVDPGPPPGAPVRFLITFDDGPSTWEPYNPTRVILDQLLRNPVQPEIKAIFFVQTRDRRAGGGTAGQALLRRANNEGHVLALHTATAGGHLRHTGLSDAELHRSLRAGMADIQLITGETPTLVRPPFWRFDERTLKAYHACGLLMLLTDISARDGKIYGWTISLRRRSHFAAALAQVRRAIQEGKLQIVEGAIPVIVTFHDTNTFTASNMEEYLQILVDQAHAVGLPLARLPFYNEPEQIQRVAGLRAEAGVYAGPP